MEGMSCLERLSRNLHGSTEINEIKKCGTFAVRAVLISPTGAALLNLSTAP